MGRAAGQERGSLPPVGGEAAQWDSPWVLVNRLDTQRRRDSLRGRFVAAPSSDPTLAVRGGELRDSGGGRAIDRHGDVGRRLEPKDARGRVNTPSRRAAPSGSTMIEPGSPPINEAPGATS